MKQTIMPAKNLRDSGKVASIFFLEYDESALCRRRLTGELQSQALPRSIRYKN